MAGVATVGAGATGIRAWLATRNFAWLTPQRLQRATVVLITAGLIVSASVIP